MKSRVLVIGINFSPELTGIGRFTGETAEWLREQGHEVQVVTSYPYYPGWRVWEGYRPWGFRHESVNGLNILRCPAYVPRNPTPLRRVLQDLSFFVTSLLAVSWLLITSKSFGVVVSVVPSLLSAFVGCWYGFWRRKSRSIVRVMDLQADAAGELGMLKPGFLLRRVLAMEAWVFRNSDWVCPLTPAMQRRIVEKGVPKQKVRVFPLWVDFNRIGPADPDAAYMSSLGIPEGRRVVLYSGAIGEKQGLEVIVELASRVRWEMPELLFIVCGSGPYRRTLEAQAADRRVENLVFRDLQPEPLFNQLLNRAWLHLVIQRQTKTESYLPSKLMNIMAVGGLALVTAFPGTTLHSIIHDHQAGMLVTEPEVEPMMRTLRLLRENPSEAERLRANALAYARQHLGRDAVLREWADSLRL